ncbi:dorsocross, partial [Asbolus verrucosus]
MFPALNIQISDLDPSADYCVFLDMVLANHCRFKYSASAGWSPAGQEEAQSQHNLFVHPESPAKGSHWMSQTISFSRVKLTNTCTPPPGQIVLSSMHKYQPRILITKTLHPEAVHWAPTRIKTFPETQFVAVTAYQNERITKLKINYNPFAKGFRENGKSHTKRKQNSYDQEMVSSKRVSTTSPPPQPILKNSKNSSDGVEQKYPILPSYNYVYPPYSAYSPY